MKAIQLNPKLYDYVLAVGTREQPLLQTIRREMQNHPEARAFSTPDSVQLLQLLVTLTQAKNILEIGTFLGYSAAAMALVLPDDAKIITCELNKEYAALAQKYWEQGNITDKIQCLQGNAVETLKNLKENYFDLIFIDANKTEYDAYYERSLQLLKQQGLLVIDNTLFYGQVVDGTDKSDVIEAIRALNTKISHDERVDIAMLTVGDGVTLAVKR